ncbi:hypothetical protein O988_07523 [Pseudogymnoascus sp. VKM F-3808]|nr:hypothetical protein O988_07523 [Pseudogymnoascus sp. VKM F-3808]
MRITMRDVVRVIFCLHLPAGEALEANTADRQQDSDWLKPASVAQVIPELVAVPESQPARSTLGRSIRCGSATSTAHFPSFGITASPKTLPRPSNNDQKDASTQTDFDGGLGQNSSQTSRHRCSIPNTLRLGRAALSSSETDKRRQAQYNKVREEQTATGQVEMQGFQGDGVGDMQATPMRPQRPTENTAGKRQETAGKYIPYRRGD